MYLKLRVEQDQAYQGVELMKKIIKQITGYVGSRDPIKHTHVWDRLDKNLIRKW